MIPTRTFTRTISIGRVARKQSQRSIASQQRCFRAASRSSAAVARRAFPSSRKAAFLLSVTIGTGCLYALNYPTNLYAEAPQIAAEMKFDERRLEAGSKKDNRDFVSSQHLQVKRSWENPGVYAWGSNSGRVVAPDSDESNIKTPRRIPYFDGKIIRDIKLDRYFGAAIAENGDLLQWGTSFSPDCQRPTPTLRGKDLIKISISRDRIIALSSNGSVYSVSASQAEQESGYKPPESTWFPFWKSRSRISYRTLKPSNMSWGEKVSNVSSGLEHCLLLTSKGRIFSAASGTEDFPSKGQLGVPGLTWTSKPEGPYDQPHEISTLNGFEIVKIAAGDYHSLALDKAGRVFAFGDNSLGQLGFDYSPESPTIDAPSLLPIERLYRKTNLSPRVTNIAAGGVNSFFTIDATRIAEQGGDEPRALGHVTADAWACGQGIWGGLGNSRWTHVQGVPTKIKALSGLFEYDEIKNRVIPIRVSYISAGSTHAAAILRNVTHVDASDQSFNWGADVLWWGGNEFYQLGTGKRNNMSNPTYIAPLDVEACKENENSEGNRFQITPRKKIRYDGRNMSVEQRVECGRGVTAVYSGT